MKKLFAFVLTIVMLVGMFSTTVFAATGDIFRDYDYRVQEHKRLLENERKDEYALSFYSLDFEAQNRMNSTSIYESKEYKTVQKVTAGITDEYEQAKAVAQWLFENVSASTCEAYAAITMNYFRLLVFLRSP